MAFALQATDCTYMPGASFLFSPTSRTAMFTRPRVYSVIFCLALCCTGFAQAVNAEDNPSGPYLGAAVGQFNVKVEDFEGLTDELGNLDDGDATAWKVFFGWRFNPYISLEADYIDLGNP